jgi:hypothetical protein
MRPSYFLAISFRCHAKSVSGVTAEPLGFGGQASAPVVVEAKAFVSQLLSQNPILLLEIVNDVALLLA